MADQEYLLASEMGMLVYAGRLLSEWNISHPIPLVGQKGGFTRWQDAAVLAIESRKNGKMTTVPDWFFDVVRAWFLKVWDLEMQVAEPRSL